MFINNFIESLSEPSFQASICLLDNMTERTNVNYQDADGNSLLHLIIIALHKKLDITNARIKQEREKLVQLCNEMGTYVEESILLIKKMLEMGFSYSLPNKNGQNFIDFFNHKATSSSDLRKIFQRVLPFVETPSKILPGRKYVQSFNFFRSSKKEHKRCLIPDSSSFLDREDEATLSLHQRLAFYEYFMRNSNIRNLVVANMGFVISDLAKHDPNHKPVFVTLPIRINNYLIYAEKTNSDTHSEKALFAALTNSSNLANLIKQLKQFHPFIYGQKIYSLVLDLNSTKEICSNCQGVLHQMQSAYDGNSFLKKFENLAIEEGYLLPQKTFIDASRDENKPRLRLTIRASGLDNPGTSESYLADVYVSTICQNPPSDIKNHPQKVLFHLPPNWWPGTSTGFINNEQDFLVAYKTDIRQKYHKAYPIDWKDKDKDETEKFNDQVKELSSQILTNRLSYYNQTAFANTGGYAQSSKDQDSSIKVKTIQQSDFPQITPALARSFIV